MSIVTDFKSINRKLNRQDQKIEFEKANPKPNWGMYCFGQKEEPFDWTAIINVKI